MFTILKDYQLLFLVNEIHEAFNDPRSLEIRVVFLDISKAFDKVWHQGLLFKLRQNGITGKLLELFRSYLIHGYISINLLTSALCPIVKDNYGNIASSKNYRAIAMSGQTILFFGLVRQ